MESNYIIVELHRSEPGLDPYIARIIRSYLTKKRAEEDLALLREACPDRSFDIIDVEYIDA